MAAYHAGVQEVPATVGRRGRAATTAEEEWSVVKALDVWVIAVAMSREEFVGDGYIVRVIANLFTKTQSHLSIQLGSHSSIYKNDR